MDAKALFKKWPEIRSDILNTVKPAERDSILQYFNEDIGYFLALLRLVVPRSSKIEEIINKFIIFSDVSIFLIQLQFVNRLNSNCFIVN